MKGLEQNYLESSNMYFDTMKGMFQNIPVKLPKTLSLKEIHKTLLHAIGGEWYMEKMNEKLQPLKRQKLIKK